MHKADYDVERLLASAAVGKLDYFIHFVDKDHKLFSRVCKALYTEVKDFFFVILSFCIAVGYDKIMNLSSFYF